METTTESKSFGHAMSVNGHPYKQQDGEWVPDDEARARQLERETEEQSKKDALVWACRSRILTEDEMKEVGRLGIQLFIRMNGGMSQGYSERDLEQRLSDLLLQQFRLRAAVKAED